MAGAAKPKLSTVKSAGPPAAKFALGSRPASLRDTGLPRVKPAVTPPKPLANTRDYPKAQSATQPAAIQPGNPMPTMGGAMKRGGKVGW